jgi:hypothetical protein
MKHYSMVLALVIVIPLQGCAPELSPADDDWPENLRICRPSVLRAAFREHGLKGKQLDWFWPSDDGRRIIAEEAVEGSPGDFYVLDLDRRSVRHEKRPAERVWLDDEGHPVVWSGLLGRTLVIRGGYEQRFTTPTSFEVDPHGKYVLLLELTSAPRVLATQAPEFPVLQLPDLPVRPQMILSRGNQVFLWSGGKSDDYWNGTLMALQRDGNGLKYLYDVPSRGWPVRIDPSSHWMISSEQRDVGAANYWLVDIRTGKSRRLGPLSGYPTFHKGTGLCQDVQR